MEAFCGIEKGFRSLCQSQSEGKNFWFIISFAFLTLKMKSSQLTLLASAPSQLLKTKGNSWGTPPSRVGVCPGSPGSMIISSSQPLHTPQSRDTTMVLLLHSCCLILSHLMQASQACYSEILDRWVGFGVGSRKDENDIRINPAKPTWCINSIHYWIQVTNIRDFASTHLSKMCILDISTSFGLRSNFISLY